ncbi:hypothetical protein [Taibaiella soli]|uniref:Uncharacterized protein n=1 Tax=Taibaiella soli TaxID=1649169 RepID=A0A2W2AVC1_9BACT|nr:hypothetical protein [Taibaiella soli]PZF71638.1 hypothetical protein DN068_16330 [Taibaiella soli]
MKKLLLLVPFLAMSGKMIAQKATVVAAFEKYNIDQTILDPSIKKTPDDLSYDYKYTSTANEKQKVTTAKYDPTKPVGNRWILTAVEGKVPTDADIKKFNKDHSKPVPNGSKIDEASMKVEKETPDQLVISYKLDPTGLPSEASFLKDCRNYLTINLQTKRLEQLQTLNEKPVKIKIFNASKLDLVIKYNYNEEMKRYLPQSEDLNLIVKFLGQEAPMETLSEYSNFAKTN